MLEQRLREIIPNPKSTFPKLESGDPYYFDQWRIDLNGEMCLYYWFWNKNRTKKKKKRVIKHGTENKNKVSTWNRYSGNYIIIRVIIRVPFVCDYKYAWKVKTWNMI